MALTKEQYVNAIGYLKVFTARIENSSQIIFDPNSTIAEKTQAKLDSETAFLKFFKLCNTIAEKSSYVIPSDKYTDQELTAMRIF